MTRIPPTLALAAALALPSSAGAQSAAPPAERATLTVRGTATVERLPDIARLSITVRTHARTLDAVVHDHQARVAKAVLALDRLKVDGIAVEQGSFGLNEEPIPVPPGGRPSSVLPTFAAETRFDLTLPIGAKLDATVSAIASSSLFEFGQIRFSLSDEVGALDDARRAAMADAGRQAQLYADGAGVRLDAVDRIADGAADSPGDGGADLPLRAAAAAPSVGISAPKALSFSGRVTVVWHIVPR